MIKCILLFAAALALPAAGLAQTLTGVKVEPAEVRAGGTVKITVSFDVENTLNCGLRLHFGDGVPGDYKINQQKDVPLVVTRPYRKPGNFRIIAEPKTVGASLKCGGRNQTATIKVAADPLAAASAPPVTDQPVQPPAPAASSPASPAQASAPSSSDFVEVDAGSCNLFVFHTGYKNNPGKRVWRGGCVNGYAEGEGIYRAYNLSGQLVQIARTVFTRGKGRHIEAYIVESGRLTRTADGLSAPASVSGLPSWAREIAGSVGPPRQK